MARPLSTKTGASTRESSSARRNLAVHSATSTSVLRSPVMLTHFDHVEFAENPDPRCPCVLLLDVSASMQGPSIGALHEGLQAFQREVSRDAVPARRVEVAIVTFGTGAEV